MPRGKQPKDGGSPSGGRNPWAPAVDPFSVGAEVASCADWDSRSEELSSVILRFLGRGQAIMFGTSRDGQIVSIGINIGEKQWSRRTVRDEGEWIGVIHELALWLNAQDAEKEAATE